MPLNYALAVGAIAGGTLIPAYIALYLFPNLKSVPTKYLAALGVGLTFWFWTDTIGDATSLKVLWKSVTAREEHKLLRLKTDEL